MPGVYCTVGRSGTVRIGDRVAVERIAATRPRRLLDDVTKRAKRMTLGLATAAADRMSR